MDFLTEIGYIADHESFNNEDEDSLNGNNI